MWVSDKYLKYKSCAFVTISAPLGYVLLNRNRRKRKENFNLYGWILYGRALNSEKKTHKRVQIKLYNSICN